jgi:hypothetical protein
VDEPHKASYCTCGVSGFLPQLKARMGSRCVHDERERLKLADKVLGLRFSGAPQVKIDVQKVRSFAHDIISLEEWAK